MLWLKSQSISFTVHPINISRGPVSQLLEAKLNPLQFTNCPSSCHLRGTERIGGCGSGICLTDPSLPSSTKINANVSCADTCFGTQDKQARLPGDESREALLIHFGRKMKAGPSPSHRIICFATLIPDQNTNLLFCLNLFLNHIKLLLAIGYHLYLEENTTA